MRLIIQKVTFALMLISLPVSLFAETLVLKDGATIETSYHWKDDETTIGYFQDGDTRYVKDDQIDWAKTNQLNKTSAAGTGSDEFTFDAASDQGEDSGGDPCLKILEDMGISYLAKNGCENVEVSEVTMESSTLYRMAGSCYDNGTNRNRSFEITFRCREKELHGVIWVEGSDKPIAKSHESSVVKFTFTDK